MYMVLSGISYVPGYVRMCSRIHGYAAPSPGGARGRLVGKSVDMLNSFCKALRVVTMAHEAELSVWRMASVFASVHRLVVLGDIVVVVVRPLSSATAGGTRSESVVDNHRRSDDELALRKHRVMKLSRKVPMLEIYEMDGGPSKADALMKLLPLLRGNWSLRNERFEV